jgi:hypothetical protein
MKTVLCDPKADGVLARLDDEARQQTAEMRRYYDAKKQATKRTTDPDSPDDMAFVRDKFVALDPEKCDLCYMLCRSLMARRVVEFGTSFGVSTLHLAAALRHLDALRKVWAGHPHPHRRLLCQLNEADFVSDSEFDYERDVRPVWNLVDSLAPRPSWMPANLSVGVRWRPLAQVVGNLRVASADAGLTPRQRDCARHLLLRYRKASCLEANERLKVIRALRRLCHLAWG